MDLRGIKGITVAELDAVDRFMRARCGHQKSRKLACLLYMIFAKLAGGVAIREIKSVMDSMDTVDTIPRLEHGDY